MKIKLKIMLPEIEVDTDSGHGSIEAIWFDGIDYSSKTVSDLVTDFMTQLDWSNKIEQAVLDELEARHLREPDVWAD